MGDILPRCILNCSQIFGAAGVEMDSDLDLAFRDALTLCHLDVSRSFSSYCLKRGSRSDIWKERKPVDTSDLVYLEYERRPKMGCSNLLCGGSCVLGTWCWDWFWLRHKTFVLLLVGSIYTSWSEVCMFIPFFWSTLRLRENTESPRRAGFLHGFLRRTGSKRAILSIREFPGARFVFHGFCRRTGW